jgi:hypothetical protein
MDPLIAAASEFWRALPVARSPMLKAFLKKCRNSGRRGPGWDDLARQSVEL